MSNKKLAEKVVLITGSSMGIGKTTALAFCKQGAKVMLHGRNTQRLANIKSELQAMGFTVDAFACDISIHGECDKLIDYTIKTFGRIDVLVNNAGVSMRSEIKNLSPELIQTIYATNTIAPIMLTKKVFSEIERNNGSIVFISSLVSFRGLPIVSLYSSSKMAITSFVQSLRIETSSDIHVGIIYVNYTEVDDEKIALDENAQNILLEKRKGRFVSSKEEVASKIVKNVIRKKKRTIIGFSGKIYFFLTMYFPNLTNWIIRRSYKKMTTLYS